MNSKLAVCLAVALAGCSGGSKLVTGKVVDASGKPVAGVQLVAAQPGELGKSMKQTFFGRSGPDGTFRIDHNPTGGPKPEGSLQLTTLAPDYAPTELIVPIPADGLTLVITHGTTIKVHALQADGSPAVGEVALRRVDTASSQILELSPRPRSTDARGNYSFTGVGPGEYSVGVLYTGSEAVMIDQGDGHESYVAEQRDTLIAEARVRVTASAVEVPAELRGTQSELTLAGKVVDSTGAGIAGASVVAKQFSLVRVGHTDENGAFLLKNVPAGSYALDCGKQGLTNPSRWQPPHAQAGSSGAVLKLVASAR